MSEAPEYVYFLRSAESSIALVLRRSPGPQRRTACRACLESVSGFREPRRDRVKPRQESPRGLRKLQPDEQRGRRSRVLKGRDGGQRRKRTRRSCSWGQRERCCWRAGSKEGRSGIAREKWNSAADTAYGNSIRQARQRRPRIARASTHAAQLQREVTWMRRPYYSTMSYIVPYHSIAFHDAPVDSGGLPEIPEGCGCFNSNIDTRAKRRVSKTQLLGGGGHSGWSRRLARWGQKSHEDRAAENRTRMRNGRGAGGGRARSQTTNVKTLEKDRGGRKRDSMPTARRDERKRGSIPVDSTRSGSHRYRVVGRKQNEQPDLARLRGRSTKRIRRGEGDEMVMVMVKNHTGRDARHGPRWRRVAGSKTHEVCRNIMEDERGDGREGIIARTDVDKSRRARRYPMRCKAGPGVGDGFCGMAVVAMVAQNTPVVDGRSTKRGINTKHGRWTTDERIV
ncbi:hypothetical protein C8R45DRAFT_1080757 [Mycena sanguinolenta]|nr:hypothetical protein C8R45DRAFT_1080757 [Mycena sanguinolenta]